MQEDRTLAKTTAQRQWGWVYATVKDWAETFGVNLGVIKSFPLANESDDDVDSS